MYSNTNQNKMEPSAEDLFWEEKIKRHIEQATNLNEVKEIARLLLKISMQRQVAIKWLVKDSLENMQKGLMNNPSA